MTEYEFTLVVDQDPTAETISDALFEAGHGDLIPEGGNGRGVVHVGVESDSLSAAILAAVRMVESVGLTVTGVQSDDLVSLRDIASRLGRTYESVRLLTTGKRGPGRFPAPLSHGQWSLYSWAEVSQWFAEHFGTEAVSAYDREIAAADHLIRARHILVGDERVELAKLVYA